MPMRLAAALQEVSDRADVVSHLRHGAHHVVLGRLEVLGPMTQFFRVGDVNVVSVLPIAFRPCHARPFLQSLPSMRAIGTPGRERERHLPRCNPSCLLSGGVMHLSEPTTDFHARITGDDGQSVDAQYNVATGAWQLTADESVSRDTLTQMVTYLHDTFYPDEQEYLNDWLDVAEGVKRGKTTTFTLKTVDRL
jgi:hypothetical protein